MADPADIGNDRAAQQLDAALSRVVGKSGPESHPDFDGAHCLDCFDVMVFGRLQLGKIRCVDCQAALEGRRSRGLA